MHVVESNNESVHLGVFDANLAPIITVDSGDTISFPDTWSHFLNEMQPGVPVDTLGKLRVANPGKGPHSIIGPIAVKGAEPGDVLEVRYKKLRPFTWGAVFNNPGSLGTGLLAQDYAEGQIKYMNLDLHAMKANFAHDITVPLKPFQGTLGLAPPDGYYPPLTPGVTSSVPPGPHAGNLDLAELSEGSTLFIPVWKPGALIFTGDSHAVQGDGEICLTALETRMKEMRIQVVLHKQKNFAWPVAETHTHWIIVGLDKDLNVAMTMAARNAIKFLATRAKISELDAYGLCSIAVSFRVTQVVDIVRGVHAMIPKSLFAESPRKQQRRLIARGSVAADRSDYHAGAELPSFTAGRSHCIGAPSIATGGRSRRAGPNPVASMDCEYSSSVAGAKPPATDSAGSLTSSCALRASEVRASNPRPVAVRCVRPRMAAAAMR